MVQWSLWLLRRLRNLSVSFPYQRSLLKLIPTIGVVAWCFPCVTYGQIKKRYDHLNTTGTPDPEHGGCFSSDCALHGLLTFCGLNWIFQVRRIIIFTEPVPTNAPSIRCKPASRFVRGTTSKAADVAIAAPRSAARPANLCRSQGNLNLKNKVSGIMLRPDEGLSISLPFILWPFVLSPLLSLTNNDLQGLVYCNLLLLCLTYCFMTFQIPNTLIPEPDSDVRARSDIVLRWDRRIDRHHFQMQLSVFSVHCLSRTGTVAGFVTIHSSLSACEMHPRLLGPLGSSVCIDHNS